MASALELILNVLGLSLCMAVSIYLFFANNKPAAALLLAGFVLHLQSALYMTFVNWDPGYGDCEDFYACLPLGMKLSTHAAQLGHYLIAFGIFLVARTARSKS